MERELFLVMEVENWLVEEAVEYILKCENIHSEQSFDPNYFNQLASDIAYYRFINIFNERLNHLNDSEKMNYAIDTFNQFVVNSPEKRKDGIYKKFCKAELTMKNNDFQLNGGTEKYFDLLLVAYKNYFKIYTDYLKEVFDRFSKTNTESTSLSNLERFKPTGKSKEIIDNLNSSINSWLKAAEKSRKISQNIKDEYIDKWQNQQVTLKLWQQNKDIDVYTELRQRGLTDEKLKKARQFRYNLYLEYVDRIFTKHKSKFESIPSQENKVIVANKDIALINDLVEGKIDEIKELRLKDIFSIENWKNTSEYIDYIHRFKCKNYNNHDIHSKECYAYAEALIKYSKFLVKYLNTPIEDKPESIEFVGFIKTDIARDAVELIYRKLSKYIDTNETSLDCFLHIFNMDIPKVTSFIKINWLGNRVELFSFLLAFSSYFENNNKIIPNNVLSKLIPSLFEIDHHEIETFYRPKKSEYEQILPRFISLVKSAEIESKAN